MPTKFLESLGDKLAEKWLSTILTPAFIFWATGLGLWIYRHSLTPLETWYNQQSQTLQIGLLISTLLGIIISALLVQSCELTILRFLEGYWPQWLSFLFIKYQQQKKNTLEKAWQSLKQKEKKQQITPQERQQFARLESLLHSFPINLMPTQFGNILRSAEERPYYQYGLDTFICWPRLWLLLPDNVKTELTEARMNLNTGARIWLWSVLFILWTPLTWWAILAGILSAYLSYQWLLNAAIIYSDLLESAFDLYRFELYKSLRWPLPKSTQDEQKSGQELTAYLWKRPDIAVTFSHQ